MRHTYSASPFTSPKNIILPAQITIDDKQGVVILKEPNLIGGSEVRLNMSCTTISIHSGLLFSDVIVESAGGKRYVLQGFSRMDAESLLRAFSRAQGGAREEINDRNRRKALRAERDEERRLRRSSRNADEMQSLEERQLERIKARMDELERLEMELAQKRQELAELQSQTSNTRVSRTSTRRRAK